jgi:transposase
MKKSGELPALEPKPRQRGRKPNDPRFDVRTALYYVTGVDLTELEGIADVTALVVVSEIGLDMSRFPTVKHFCAWTRRGRGRAAQALCLAASGLWKNLSALGGFLRRLKARLGPQKAVMATAHKLARQVYQALKSGVLPATLSAAEYAAAQQARAVEALKKKARRLGLVVTEGVAQAAAAPSS